MNKGNKILSGLAHAGGSRALHIHATQAEGNTMENELKNEVVTCTLCGQKSVIEYEDEVEECPRCGEML